MWQRNTTAVVAAILFTGIASTVVAQEPLPALFDDFDYSSSELDRGQFSEGVTFEGSVFGRNDWLTSEGIDSSRAWRRYNWDDLEYSCTRCGVQTHPDSSRIRIQIKRDGIAGGDSHNLIPTIKSGFITGRGTYVSRLRIHSPPDEGNFLQAFWTSATDVLMIDQGDDWIAYMSETDIEAYSPSYTGPGKRDLGVANFRGKHATRDGDDFEFTGFVANHDYRVQNGNLQCVEGSDGKWRGRVDCRQVLFDRDWIMSISIEPRQYVEYAFRSADGRYAAGVIRRARTQLDILPVRLEQYPPKDEVIAIFGLYSDGIERRLVSDLILEIDWYYHTREIISLGEALAQVRYWKSMHPRVNTLGRPFNAMASRSEFDFSIAGPKKLPEGRLGSWRLELTSLNTTYIMERFEYAFLECSSHEVLRTGEFVPIREPELLTRIPSRYDGMVIEAVAKNRWSGVVRSATYVVSHGARCEVRNSE